MRKNYYYAFTPAGSMLTDTHAKTEQECWQKLEKCLAHMPYRNLDEIKERGYKVESLRVKPD